jgi:CRP-like cAMP-binding protein
MPPLTQSDVRNLLLALLPADDFERIAPHLSRVELHMGQVLYTPGDRITHLYFPDTAVIHSVYITREGATTEVGVAGNKGVFGVPVVLGVERVPYHAIVEVPGAALRIDADALKGECARGGSLDRLILRYTYALLIQTAQLAVCNCTHTVEERLCRWLLFIHDRTGRTEFRLTHETISGMLGAHRSGVSVAAKALQRAGLIRYHRGLIQIEDFGGLGEVACECFELVRREFGRVLCGEPLISE